MSSPPYASPPLPDDDDDPPNETNNNKISSSSSSSSSIKDEKFGKPLRDLHFPHHPTHLLRLNNGSFGACPHTILSKQSTLRAEWLSDPDAMWPRLSSLLSSSRQSVAAAIRASHDDVVLLDNATVGSTMVADDALRRYRQRRDAAERTGREVGVILVANVTYRAVINAVTRICEESNGGLAMVTVAIPFPVSSVDDIVAAYETTLSQIGNDAATTRYWPCLAILDHVSSVPSYRHPISDLVRRCREGGFERIFVDGAHALGTMSSLDVPRIGADYYVGNVHKWMMCPTSAAFFWSRSRDDDDEMHHPVTSHHYGRGLAEECAMLGTRDYSAMMVVGDAMAFYRSLSEGGGGEDEAYRRNHALVVTAGRYLATLWGTMLGTSEDMATTMIMVGLPSCLGDDEEASKALKWRLYREHDIVVQYPYPCDGRLWLRLSAAVYNYMEEYRKLGDVILGMVEKNKDGR